MCAKLICMMPKSRCRSPGNGFSFLAGICSFLVPESESESVLLFVHTESSANTLTSRLLLFFFKARSLVRSSWMSFLRFMVVLAFARFLTRSLYLKSDGAAVLCSCCVML